MAAKRLITLSELGLYSQIKIHEIWHNINLNIENSDLRYEINKINTN